MTGQGCSRHSSQFSGSSDVDQYSHCRLTLAGQTFDNSAREHLSSNIALLRTRCLSGSQFRFAFFTESTVLIIPRLCLVYSIALRALLNVFVIRIPVGSHQFLFPSEFVC